MAAFYRLPSGLWRAQVSRRGVRRSSSFKSKLAAIAWASRVEGEILDQRRGVIPNHTVGELLERYQKEVSPKKKGERWERIRILLIQRDLLAKVRLRNLTRTDVASWQERRLEAVSSASVRRERNLLSAAFEHARVHWGWLDQNPFRDLPRPKDGRVRDRIASPAEIDQLTSLATPSMRRVILFALETGMRAGEIASLRDVHGRVAHLQDTKNGEARKVPLSQAAIDVWEGGFGLTSGSISAMFARLCARAKIDGLTFHDLRATACTRLAKKLLPQQLARMLGHKDLRMTMRYYRESAEDIAKKL